MAQIVSKHQFCHCSLDTICHIWDGEMSLIIVVEDNNAYRNHSLLRLTVSNYANDLITLGSRLFVRVHCRLKRLQIIQFKIKESQSHTRTFRRHTQPRSHRYKRKSHEKRKFVFCQATQRFNKVATSSKQVLGAFGRISVLNLNFLNFCTARNIKCC